MRASLTPEIYHGAPGFKEAVRYFRNKPRVGLAVARAVMSPEEVALIDSVAPDNREKSQDPLKTKTTLTRVAVHKVLTDHDISLQALMESNVAFWEQDVPTGTDARSVLAITGRGIGVEPHMDNTQRLRVRPVGVSASLSIGHCVFAASLPAPDLWTSTTNGDGSSYRTWVQDTPSRHVTHYASLQPGDVAFWLQPGTHSAETTDPNRFACVFTTLVPYDMNAPVSA